MRMYQYINAYRKLAEENGKDDPHKYDTLKLIEVEGGVEVVHVLDALEELEVVDPDTGEKI